MVAIRARHLVREHRLGQGNLVRALQGADLDVETGEFGAMMEVELVNDGPVTLLLER